MFQVAVELLFPHMRFWVFVLVLAGVALPAAAQQMPTDDPVATASIKLGPVALDPHFAITNAGGDSNVFNSATDPQSDFTFTAAPSTDLWVRTQRGLFSANGGLDMVYFHEFESERSINSHARGQYEYRFNRVRPFVYGRTLNTRERPGYEIDVRARRYETELGGGLDARVGSKGTVGVAYRETEFSFAGDAVFNGLPLNETLARRLRSAEANWRHRLTSQTTFVLRGLREQQIFDNEVRRNSVTNRIRGGFELGQFALIRGSAMVGFMSMSPTEGGTFARYTGPTADVNVAYSAPTRTRLALGVARDVQYSVYEKEVYYLQTGWTLTLTQRVVGLWDIQVQGGRDRLNYQGILGAGILSHLDTVDRVGGGIGYQLRDDTRISFDVRSIQRQSPVPSRDYNTLRAGLSVTYGL
jgi:hypothetical protein